MSDYIITTECGELYHHGILGMKWGHRSGPPYPLKPSMHTAAERKAGWQKSLGSGSSNSGGSGGSKNTSKKNYKVVTTKAKSSSSESSSKKEDNNEEAKKSSIDKKKLARNIAIGVGAAAAVGLTAYLGSKYVKSQAARIAAEEGMNWYKGILESGEHKLRPGLSQNEAALNQGKSIYEQVSRNISTKDAVRTNLEYLGKGKSFKNLTSSEDLGRQKSTAELALKAVNAQTKAKVDNLKESINARKSAEKVGNLDKSVVDKMKNVVASNRPKSTKPDLSGMSDADLQAAVRRMNLEKQYKSLTRKDTALERFNKKAGPIAAATGTALTLYSNADRIKNIAKNAGNKKKNNNNKNNKR